MKAKGKCEKHRVLIANQLLKRSEVISVDEDVMELQIRQIAQNMNDPGRKISPIETSESIPSSPEKNSSPKKKVDVTNYIKKRLNPFALYSDEEIEQNEQFSESEPHLDSEAELHEELVIFREELEKEEIIRES